MLEFTKKSATVDARSGLTLLHAVLQITGLTPLSISRSTSLNYLYPFLIECAVIYGTIIGFRDLSDLLYSLNSPVHLATGNFTLLCVMVVCWVSHFCSIIRYKIYERALQKLTKTESSLNLLYVDNAKNPTVGLYLFYSALFLFLQTAADTFLLLSHGFGHTWSYLVAFHVPLTYIILGDCRAKMIFEMLNLRFKRVNRYFSHALKLDRIGAYKTVFTIPHQYLTKTKIKELSYIHCSLMRITRNFNSYFSPMLLLEIAAFFTVSTFNAFSFFYLLTDTHLIDYRQSLIFFAVYTTMIIFIKLNYLLKSAVKLTKEV